MAARKPGDSPADHQDIGELLRQPGGLKWDEIATLGDGLGHLGGNQNDETRNQNQIRVTNDECDASLILGSLVN